MIYKLILIVHLLFALILISLILMQCGKGADAGATFSSGASSTIFGSAGSNSFLARLIAVIACLFAMTSIVLTLISNQEKILLSINDKKLHIDQYNQNVSGKAKIPELP